MDPKYLLALNSHPKIGSQTLKKILAVFPDPEKLWQTKNFAGKLDGRIAGLVSEVIAKINPDEVIDRLQKYDVGYMTMYDKSYPEMLREIYDAPAVLYIRGDITVLKTLSLAVVGSRKYTTYGKNVAYKISKECAEAGLTIVSGLALGIDAEAHQAALDVKGKTIGILGCGLDHIYPVSNFSLGKAMIENGGAVISEFPLGTPPMKHNFPARNRIIAGISKAILVVEAAESSGALITAYQGLEYNREIYAVPGNIDSENSIGTNKLIQEGAKLVRSSADILTDFNIEAKKSAEKAKELLPKTEEESLILDILAKTAENVDAIVLKSKLNVVLVSSTLSMLEMKGMVQNIGGGRYQIVK